MRYKNSHNSKVKKKYIQIFEGKQRQKTRKRDNKRE